MSTFRAIALVVVSCAVTLAILAQSGSARAQQPAPSPTQPRPFADRATGGAGATIFGNVCGACHGKDDIKEAMSPDMLKQLTPEKLYESMTTGSMQNHADAARLTDEQRVAIAEWVSGRRLGSTEKGGASTMSNVCATHPPVANLSAPSWNGWSPDMTKNNRYPASEGGRRSRTQRVRTPLTSCDAMGFHRPRLRGWSSSGRLDCRGHLQRTGSRRSWMAGSSSVPIPDISIRWMQRRGACTGRSRRRRACAARR